ASALVIPVTRAVVPPLAVTLQDVWFPVMAFSFLDEAAFVPYVAVVFDHVVSTLIDVARTRCRHDLDSLRGRRNADFELDAVCIGGRRDTQRAGANRQRGHDASYLHGISCGKRAGRD